VEWVETTGRSVEDALEAALDELGVDNDEVEYEVLEEAKGGMFGRREARIRARVRPLSRAKPGEQRRRRSTRQRPGQRSGGGRSSGGGGGGRGDRASVAPAGRKTESDGDRSGGGTPRKRGRRGGRSGGTRHEETGTMEERVSEPSVSVDEQAAAAETFTVGLVEAFGADANVAMVVDEESILVDITGTDLGLLVGPRGVTLQAIEDLVRTVVQRQTEGHGVRINVDVAGYRAKRREALAGFARELAEKVRESGADQALEPMSASDRKVVHDTVAEIDGVATISEGEEPRRRVVMHPA
jgi:spoIIIJ-associated protein